ncbi:MAG TPA: D-glycero-beta-D-manno-heptose 1-phosphate adenylyltransferase [Frankiaceae bacterium]|nr:D-glycero-beta-D-manno-heptose 1-phosphate adenylyltransferase [Frankiaceae bacterium]
MSRRPLPTGRQHVDHLVATLPALDLDRLDAWGRTLAQLLPAGGRILVAGNGGSAAEAQHLTAELVGRLRDDRVALSALALSAETSSLTAIANDYGYDEAFARQVRAHGRAGDVLLTLSTSGRSRSVIGAAEAARAIGMRTWALTGPAGSPLAAVSDEVVSIEAPHVATVQEAHLVAVHLICAAVDVALGVAPAEVTRTAGPAAPVASAGTVDETELDLLDRTDDLPALVPALVPALLAGLAPCAPAARRTPLVVVGDALLDVDLEGSVGRLSPDAPVPVVDDLEDHPRPGGAGLAALLAARDNRPVTLITALAPDAGGRRLFDLLVAAGIRVVDLGLDGQTPEKIRVRSDGRSLLRLDRGGCGGIVGPLTDEATAVLADARAVLVADYGRGVAAEPGLRAALEALPHRVPIVWDPHPRGPEPVRGCRLVTPNSGEAAHFAPGTGAGSSLSTVTRRARELAQRWSAGAVAVTLGSRGALLAEGADTPPLVAPAPPAPLSDPCGAGDRFASTAAGLLADGLLPSEAMTGAVAAASRFVAAGGAAAIRVDAEPAHADADAQTFATASDVIARTRAVGGTVVATGGCFDLLHAGHVRVLQQARALGECLIVLLNSDDSVRRLKGPERPLVPAPDRAAVLLALGCVDAVVVFDEDTPIDVLGELQPDVWAKGGDYAVADLPEAPVVESWGGQAVVLPYLTGRSTTRLIQEAARRGN